MGEERLILPPPVQRRRESEILNEIPNVLGLVLWQDVRHLHVWVEATEAARPPRHTPATPSPRDFFNASPPAWVIAKRRDARAQCGELASALDEFWSVVTAPLSVDPAAIAEGCRQVVEWALAHEHTQTAIEFAEAAALVAPEDAGIANLAGRVTRNAGEYARAEVWFNRAIGYARERNDEVELTRAHLGYGTLHKELGRVREARKHLNSGSRIARRLGQPSLAAEAQHDICALLIERGHYAEAEQHALIALRWYPKSHPRFPLFAADIALLLTLRNNFVAAARVLRGTVRVLDNPAAKAAVLALYSRALAGARHTDEATHQGQRALYLLKRHHEWEALALWHLAAAERLLDRRELAEAHAVRALEIATERADRETARRSRRTLSHIRSRTPPAPAIVRKNKQFRHFIETLTTRISEWAPRRARTRRAPWGDQWAA